MTIRSVTSPTATTTPIRPYGPRISFATGDPSAFDSTTTGAWVSVKVLVAVPARALETASLIAPLACAVEV